MQVKIKTGYQVKKQAKDDAIAIPGWATMTAAQVESYIESNVNSLADAKTVLKAMAKLLVALRNHNFPELEGD